MSGQQNADRFGSALHQFISMCLCFCQICIL